MKSTASISAELREHGFYLKETKPGIIHIVDAAGIVKGWAFRRKYMKEWAAYTECAPDSGFDRGAPFVGTKVAALDWLAGWIIDPAYVEFKNK